MIIGYARLLARGQDIQEQVSTLLKLGVPEKNIYVDQIVYRDRYGTALKSIISNLEQSQVIYTTCLACLAPNLHSLIKILNTFHDAGAYLVSLSEGINTKDDDWLHKAAIAFDKFIADHHKASIVHHQQITKDSGKCIGRKRVILNITPSRVQSLLERGHTVTEIAKKYRVARSTIYRMLDRKD